MAEENRPVNPANEEEEAAVDEEIRRIIREDVEAAIAADNPQWLEDQLDDEDFQGEIEHIIGPADREDEDDDEFVDVDDLEFPDPLPRPPLPPMTCSVCRISLLHSTDISALNPPPYRRRRHQGDDSHELRTCPCGHTFHKVCLLSHFRRNAVGYVRRPSELRGLCPICNRFTTIRRAYPARLSGDPVPAVMALRSGSVANPRDDVNLVSGAQESLFQQVEQTLAAIQEQIRGIKRSVSVMEAGQVLEQVQRPPPPAPPTNPQDPELRVDPNWGVHFIAGDGLEDDSEVSDDDEIFEQKPAVS